MNGYVVDFTKPKALKPHIGKNAKGWFVRWMDWHFTGFQWEWAEHKTFEYSTWQRAWQDHEDWIRL